MLLRRARRTTATRPPVLAEPRRFRAQVAYDGAAFAGWQRQRSLVSAQELLEVALEEATGLPVQVVASGRTDAGVHAEGQVAAFDSVTGLPPSALTHLCSHVLPDTLHVRCVDTAPPGFDPQRACVGKLYRYLVRVSDFAAPGWRATAWQVPGPLDIDAMRAAAVHLVGTHDFRGFRTDPGRARRGQDTVRTVTRIGVEQSHELVRIEAEGPGFLYMMVRNLAAVLVEVGAGRQPPSWAADVRAARRRARLPQSAPPQGLCLVRVDYDPPWPDAPSLPARPGRRRG